MQDADFWVDPKRAQVLIKELQDLKTSLETGSVYGAGDAVLTIYAGAGGDDAEDWVSMLFGMYKAYVNQKGFSLFILDENQNSLGGYRNITFEIVGKIGRAHV